MKLETSDIKHLATLSALEFSDDRIEGFKNEFNQIIDLVEKISNADVASEKIEYNPIPVDMLREDEVRESFSQDQVLQNAPSKKMGSFSVPLMME